jgi:error-prone DNA polymerase
LRLIKGLRQTAAQALVAARGEGRFGSIADFSRRTRLGRAILARLAAADAFGSLGLSRRAALWYALDAVDEELPLFAGLVDEDGALPPLSEMPMEQEVTEDYESTGLSLKSHPISFVRPMLDKLGVSTAAALNAPLPDGRGSDGRGSDGRTGGRVKKVRNDLKVAGLVLVRQRPSTAKGTIFMTLEDETGTANLIVWPRVWERYRRVAARAVALIAHGQVERSGSVVHFCASRLDDVSECLRSLASQSRDFR